MGADAFVAFYGIKIPLDPDNDEEIDDCGEGSDPRCLLAKNAGLQFRSDRMTDGVDYFLFIGQEVACLGLENDQYKSQTIESLVLMAAEVDSKLRRAGFTESPRLHFQFIGQY